MTRANDLTQPHIPFEQAVHTATTLGKSRFSITGMRRSFHVGVEWMNSRQIITLHVAAGSDWQWPAQHNDILARYLAADLRNAIVGPATFWPFDDVALRRVYEELG